MKEKINFISAIGVIVIAFLFISLCAQISFDLPGGIPFSGQSFAILSVGICCGWIIGGITVSIYLIAGLLGAPIFAGGASGFNHFLDGSGGYFVGFIIAIIVVGLLKKKGFDRTFGKNTLAFLVGHFIILLCGTIGIYLIHNLETAYQYGFKPFILAAVFKSLLGGVVMPIYYQIRKEW